jgi:hypothetical protein
MDCVTVLYVVICIFLILSMCIKIISNVQQLIAIYNILQLELLNQRFNNSLTSLLQLSNLQNFLSPRRLTYRNL